MVKAAGGIYDAVANAKSGYAAAGNIGKIIGQYASGQLGPATDDGIGLFAGLIRGVQGKGFDPVDLYSGKPESPVNLIGKNAPIAGQAIWDAYQQNAGADLTSGDFGDVRKGLGPAALALPSLGAASVNTNEPAAPRTPAVHPRIVGSRMGIGTAPSRRSDRSRMGIK